MKIRPIVCSTDEIRAVLDGRLSQFWRPIKFRLPSYVPPDQLARAELVEVANGMVILRDNISRFAPIKCPYGISGDSLWAKEMGMISVDGLAWMYPDTGGKISPGAPVGSENWAREWKPCPAISMPGWASRITLRVKSVDARRVQTISERDAMESGCFKAFASAYPGSWTRRADFAYRWDVANKRFGYAWEINPWAWRIEVEQIKDDEK